MHQYRQFAQQCAADVESRGEVPFSAVLVYGVRLDESTEGADAAIQATATADRVIAYNDHGVTAIMQRAIDHAVSIELPVEERRLHGGGQGNQPETVRGRK